MDDLITLQKVDEVHMRVITDPGIGRELVEYFSFRPPGYQFVPSYKMFYYK